MLNLFCFFSGILLINTFALNAQGYALDASFGAGGKVLIDGDTTNLITHQMALQADGKILVVGETGKYATGYDFLLLRFNTDGSLDTSFDSDGIVIHDFNSKYDYAHEILLQPDGKILIGGETNPYSGTNRNFALARYNTNGSLDTSFNNDGIFTYDLNNYEGTGGIALQADGKIIVAGFTQWMGSTGTDLFTARLHANGSFDTTFGDHGILTVTEGISTSETANIILIQPDGKIITAGKSNTYPYIVRFNADGTLDNAFGGDGTVIITISVSNMNDMALQPNGKIIAAGAYSYYTPAESIYNTVLCRVNADGSMDTEFDGDGKVTTAFSGVYPTEIRHNYTHAVLVQSDSKILAAGFFKDDSPEQFMLMRYWSDGQLDYTFDSTGRSITDFGATGGCYAECLCKQTDGKILVAGWASGPNTDIVLARYDPGFVGVNEIPEENKIIAYPNPANNFISVSSKVNLDDAIIKIIDITGQTVLQNSISGNSFTLDVSNQSPGIYFIVVNSNGGKLCEKLIIE